VIRLTRQDVLAHQATVPWPELYQIEQDLLLSLAMRAIFSDNFLRTQVAMRGGTVLHKVHLAPAARYSEDIDLVVFGDRPEEHVRKGLMRVLRPIFGREQSWAWTHLKLAVRNAARQSRILRCIYKVPSVAEPGRTLTIEVETNVSERTPHLELMHPQFEFTFRDETLTTPLISFHLNEMLATKMRALFQRRKGRDLFDLEVAMSRGDRSVLSVPTVIAAFRHYMRAERTHVPRREFIEHLHDCLRERTGFCSDLKGRTTDPIADHCLYSGRCSVPLSDYTTFGSMGTALTSSLYPQAFRPPAP
jgi:predicted nucleotidyltransferase component of viral defense system